MPWFHSNGADGRVERTWLTDANDPPPAAEYKIGLDLGTVEDYTALAVLQVDGADRPGEARYDVVHLERWRSAAYPRIVEEVAAIVRRPELHEHHALLIDGTGCGLPVVQMFHRANVACIGITITGGDEVGHNAMGWTVPKASLVSALSVVVQTHRIKVATSLPTGRQLATEMQAFTRRQNPVTGKNQFAVWREGEHDDVTLAVAMAVWHTESIMPVRFY
jgi:hypothetical protein